MTAVGQDRPPLRVAVVQFAPVVKLGQVEHNVKKATEICSRIEPSSVDLVCLPEMIFTGYVFPNANAISPYLEDPQSGPTSQFCKSLASKLGCYVIAGYPEILKADERGTREDGSLMVGGNSAIIAGPTGETFGYRKTNMFETDKTWAKPGEGFKTFTLPNLPPGLQDLSLAICMDLNPHPPTVWTLEGGPYELADYCRSSAGKPRTKVLVLLNAWLDSQPDPESKWDTQVLNYWAARLRPLWDVEHSSNESPSDIDDEVARETIVIICNRCGSDGDVLFAGTSCIMKLHEGTGEPDVLGVMGRQEEGLRVWAL